MTVMDHRDTECGESVSEYYDYLASMFPEHYPTVTFYGDRLELKEHRLRSMRQAIASWEEENRA